MTTPPPFYQAPIPPQTPAPKVMLKSNYTPKTRIVFYNSERAMQKGVMQEQLKGWDFVSSEVVDQGYGFFKTCFLGCLFLPLALLGRKRQHFKVTYKRME